MKVLNWFCYRLVFVRFDEKDQLWLRMHRMLGWYLPTSEYLETKDDTRVSAIEGSEVFDPHRLGGAWWCKRSWRRNCVSVGLLEEFGGFQHGYHVRTCASERTSFWWELEASVVGIEDNHPFWFRCTYIFMSKHPFRTNDSVELCLVFWFLSTHKGRKCFIPSSRHRQRLYRYLDVTTQDLLKKILSRDSRVKELQIAYGNKRRTPNNQRHSKAEAEL